MGNISPHKRHIELTDDWKDEKKIEINPSWIIQTLILCLLGIAGFFISSQLSLISDEITLSRIERAQLRADLSALEVGLRGDRFSRSDWRVESDKISRDLESIRSRLLELERKSGKN